MNEVEPWSSRARRSLERAGSVVSRRLASGWAWFTDLGQGAWLLALGVAALAAIGIGIVMGRGGADPSACGNAMLAEHRIERADGHRLDAAQVVRLHHDAKKLDALAPEALGAGPAALTYAAQMAAAAQVGETFDAGASAGKYQSACGDYP
jgi:hypothetical protein